MVIEEWIAATLILKHLCTFGRIFHQDVEVGWPRYEEAGQEWHGTRLQLVKKYLNEAEIEAGLRIEAQITERESGRPLITHSIREIQLPGLFHRLADDTINDKGEYEDGIEWAVKRQAIEEEAGGDVIS